MELSSMLDAGEAEAITLALEWKADVILIDEMDGRRAARDRGLITAGTLNILAQAAERGWLDYDGVVGRLRSETNFRTTLAVIEAARAAASSK
jgi:predicted nucleic acid-binding protein